MSRACRILLAQGGNLLLFAKRERENVFCTWRTFSNAFSEDFWHAIELALDAVQTASNADRVVKDGVLCIVRICLVAGLELVEAENIVNDFLFLEAGLAGCVRACS
jgi:hypothetical protein